MWTHLWSRDSGLSSSVSGYNSVFWCQAATFLPTAEAEVWLRIFEWKSFQRRWEGGKRGGGEKTRWPFLSPALPLRRLKTQPLWDRGGASERERERERERKERRGNTHSPSGLVRMWTFLFPAVQMSLVSLSQAFLSLFPRIIKNPLLLTSFPF